MSNNYIYLDLLEISNKVIVVWIFLLKWLKCIGGIVCCSKVYNVFLV